jgi:PAS domain-containing protein
MTIAAIDGTLRRVHGQWWIPMVEGKPQYNCTQLALLDLTQMKSSEQALSTERDRLKDTLQSMAEGVVTVDNAGVVRVINASACRITGRAGADAVGRPLAAVCLLRHEKTGMALPGPEFAARVEGRVVELAPQTVLAQPDGSLRLVEGRCARVDRRAPVSLDHQVRNPARGQEHRGGQPDEAPADDEDGDLVLLRGRPGRHAGDPVVPRPGASTLRVSPLRYSV